MNTSAQKTIHKFWMSPTLYSAASAGRPVSWFFSQQPNCKAGLKWLNSEEYVYLWTATRLLRTPTPSIMHDTLQYDSKSLQCWKYKNMIKGFLQINTKNTSIQVVQFKGVKNMSQQKKNKWSYIDVSGIYQDCSLSINFLSIYLTEPLTKLYCTWIDKLMISSCSSRVMYSWWGSRDIPAAQKERTDEKTDWRKGRVERKDKRK